MTEPAVGVSPERCYNQICQILAHISLICTVEEEALMFCSAPRIQPAKVVTSMNESAAQALLSHSTSFPSLYQSVFTVFQFLPDSHLPLPRLPSILSSITWGLYFLERRQKKDSREWIQRWPRFSAHLSCSFLSSRRTSKGQGRGRGLQAAWWTSENLDPVWNRARVMWRDWNLAEGKAWWDFSAAVSHTLHTSRAGCVVAMTLKLEVKTSFGAKQAYFITKRNIECFSFSENICSFRASSRDSSSCSAWKVQSESVWWKGSPLCLLLDSPQLLPLATHTEWQVGVCVWGKVWAKKDECLFWSGIHDAEKFPPETHYHWVTWQKIANKVTCLTLFFSSHPLLNVISILIRLTYIEGRPSFHCRPPKQQDICHKITAPAQSLCIFWFSVCCWDSSVLKSWLNSGRLGRNILIQPVLLQQKDTRCF